MDVFSTVAGALALTGSLLKVSKEFLSLINGIKQAPSHVENAAIEVQRLYETLAILRSVLPFAQSSEASSSSDKSPERPEVASMNSIVKNLAEVLSNCLDLIEQLDARIKSSINDGRRLGNVWKGLKWDLAGREAVDRLRTDINSHKLTLVIACNALSILNNSTAKDKLLDRLSLMQRDIEQVRRRIGEEDTASEIATKEQDDGVSLNSRSSVSTSKSFALKRFLDDTESIWSGSRPSSRDPSMIVSSGGSHRISSDSRASVRASVDPAVETSDTPQHMAQIFSKIARRQKAPEHRRREKEDRHSWYDNSSDNDDEDDSPGLTSFFMAGDDEDSSPSQFFPGKFTRMADVKFNMLFVFDDKENEVDEHDNHTNTCMGCNEDVTKGEVWAIDYEKRMYWHPKCLTCFNCNKQAEVFEYSGFCKVGFRPRHDEARQDSSICSPLLQPWISDTGLFACSECVKGCGDCGSLIREFDEAVVRGTEFICSYCALVLPSRQASISSYQQLIHREEDKHQSSASSAVKEEEATSILPRTRYSVEGGSRANSLVSKYFVRPDSLALPRDEEDPEYGEILIMLSEMSASSNQPPQMSDLPSPILKRSSRPRPEPIHIQNVPGESMGLPTPPDSGSRRLPSKQGHWSHRFRAPGHITPPSSGDW